MSNTLIAVVTIIYLLVALSFYLEGKTGLAITFGGYSLANLGLIMANME
jgi:hypothetical protein